MIARQQTGSAVQIEWSPPIEPNGLLIGYTIMFVPPLPPLTINVSPKETSKIIHESYFKPKHNYTFWVIAKNSEFDSNSSETVSLEFDSMGDIDDLKDLTVKNISSTSVNVTWNDIRAIDGYAVKRRLPFPYPELPIIKTNKPNITCK